VTTVEVMGPGRHAAPTDEVLTVEDLAVTFPGLDGPDVNAVRGLSFGVRSDEVLAIVGESGSGKSVTSLAIMGLLPTNAVVTGSVKLGGRELTGLDDRQLSDIRGRDMSMIFQEPLSALTPVYTVGQQVAEAILIHSDTSRQKAMARAVELLDIVGIPNAKLRSQAFPHEFSGGMRQRVMIAMAIANNPKVIIADEPTTALDVTIQAQILDVLQTARRETGAGIIMITHDLGVVAGLADRVMVMYAGRPVEVGSTDQVYDTPRMPYTMGLLGSIPRIDAKGVTDRRQPAVAGRAADRVSVRAALPARHRQLPRDRARPRDGRRGRPLRRLPSQARHRGRGHVDQRRVPDAGDRALGARACAARAA
jgi:peptide/nickel transport system ATP-binding protein